MAEGTGSHGYVLAAAGREEEEFARLEQLQRLFDGPTAERLGLVQPGWRALEVAAGRGSVAAMIADRIGPAGHLVATDIDLGPSAHLTLPNATFLRHDILIDPLEPLGGPGSFDFVHARFFLQHVYAHEDSAIRRMVELLKPGGWLMIEDSDAATMAAGDPDHPLSEAYDQLMAGSTARMRQARIVDPAPGRGLPSRFRKAGLTELRHEGRILDHGGSALAGWYLQSIAASRRGFDEAGHGAAINLIVQALGDPDFWFQSGAFFCAWGRKPA